VKRFKSTVDLYGFQGPRPFRSFASSAGKAAEVSPRTGSSKPVFLKAELQCVMSVLMEHVEQVVDDRPPGGSCYDLAVQNQIALMQIL
jgi:hypothetical protein